MVPPPGFAVTPPVTTPLLTRIDPHVHTAASPCSRLTDEELLDWFDRNPEFAVVVSDHMAWSFYRRPEVLARAGRILFSTEITLGGRFDFLLLSADPALLGRLEAIDGGSLRRPPQGPGDALVESANGPSVESANGPSVDSVGCPVGPEPGDRPGDPPGAALTAVFADPRVLVTFAHPHLFGVGLPSDMPGWLLDMPVDFLECNMTRLATHPRLGASRSTAGVAAAVRDSAERLGRLRDECFPGSRFVVGSDAHDPQSLGRTYLRLNSPSAQAAGVWRAMQRGDFLGHLEVRGIGFTVHPERGLEGAVPA